MIPRKITNKIFPKLLSATDLNIHIILDIFSNVFFLDPDIGNLFSWLVGYKDTLNVNKSCL